MRSAIRFATVLVLVLSLGLHWAFLQSVAWVGMIVTYSRNVPLAEAVSNTFDGEHPCALCKVIQKGRSEEKRQDQQQAKPVSKIDLGLVWQAIAFHFDCDREPIPFPDVNALSRREEPPKPRPRTASLDSPA